MRILVTGSSGRIGSAIVRRLGPDHDVVGLDARPAPATAMVVDVGDGAAVRAALHGIDALVHTAALHAPHVGLVSKREFRRVNVDATRLLLDACGSAGVRRVVYTSTTSLYGEALMPVDEAVWVTEDLAPRPRDVYDETKIAAEELCREAASSGLTCVSLRMSRCFPELDELVATYRLYRGVDERDVAEAHALALNADVSGFVALNVSAVTPFRREDCRGLLHDAASVIRERVPWAEAEFRARGWRLPESIDRVYVVEKAMRVLGFRPRYGLAELLRGGDAGTSTGSSRMG